MKRVIITGVEGFIGRRLFSAFVNKGCTVLGIDPQSRYMEIGESSIRCQLQENELNAWHPDSIILCGAVKSLTDCQGRADSIRLNVFDMEKYIQYAWNRSNVQVVFVSSDMVFGGLAGHGLFAEVQPVFAMNAYGRMKIAGEQIVSLLPNASIVRTSMVYGALTCEEEDVYSGAIGACELLNQTLFYYWAMEQIHRYGKVVVACNVFSSPTWVEDVVRDIVQIVETRMTGVFHSSGPERLSRFEMLRRVFAPLNLQNLVCCQEVQKDGIRPLDVSLDSKMTRERLGTVCHRVDDVMIPIMRQRISA